MTKAPYDGSTFYELLGVSEDAARDEIRRAFLRCAQQHHPDLNPDDALAEVRFRTIRYAYEVLIDPIQRSAYDDQPIRFHERVGGTGRSPCGSRDPLTTPVHPVHRPAPTWHDDDTLCAGNFVGWHRSAWYSQEGMLLIVSGIMTVIVLAIWLLRFQHEFDVRAGRDRPPVVLNDRTAGEAPVALETTDEGANAPAPPEHARRDSHPNGRDETSSATRTQPTLRTGDHGVYSSELAVTADAKEAAAAIDDSIPWTPTPVAPEISVNIPTTSWHRDRVGAPGGLDPFLSTDEMTSGFSPSMASQSVSREAEWSSVSINPNVEAPRTWESSKPLQGVAAVYGDLGQPSISPEVTPFDSSGVPGRTSFDLTPLPSSEPTPMPSTLNTPHAMNAPQGTTWSAMPTAPAPWQPPTDFKSPDLGPTLPVGDLHRRGEFSATPTFGWMNQPGAPLMGLPPVDHRASSSYGTLAPVSRSSISGDMSFSNNRAAQFMRPRPAVAPRSFSPSWQGTGSHLPMNHAPLPTRPSLPTRFSTSGPRRSW